MFFNKLFTYRFQTVFQTDFKLQVHRNTVLLHLDTASYFAFLPGQIYACNLIKS